MFKQHALNVSSSLNSRFKSSCIVSTHFLPHWQESGCLHVAVSKECWVRLRNFAVSLIYSTAVEQCCGLCHHILLSPLFDLNPLIRTTVVTLVLGSRGSGGGVVIFWLEDECNSTWKVLHKFNLIHHWCFNNFKCLFEILAFRTRGEKQQMWTEWRKHLDRVSFVFI